MKICLIGSTRFKELYFKANRDLTARGHVVYTVAFHTSQEGEAVEVSTEEKEVLDLVHLKKILESDAVILITDDTGYFGDSTRRELLWAEINQKPLLHIRDIEHLWNPTDLTRIRAELGV